MSVDSPGTQLDDSLGAVRVHVTRHRGYHQPAYKQDISSGVAVAVTASRVVLDEANCHVLMGWSLTETTGAAAASVRLRDGRLVSAPVIARINLAANESTREPINAEGIRVRTGAIFLEVISGSVEGVVYYR